MFAFCSHTNAFLPPTSQYGIAKKIEHFWKGLSNDGSKISALPPQQYGDRFLEFMSGITMSPEDAAREAQDRGDAAAADAASAAPNGDVSNAVDNLAFDGLAISTGRDKNKDAGSNLRHRSGPGAGASSESGREIKNAHRSAEHEAQKASPAANDAGATQTTVPVSGGMLLPGRVASSGASGSSPSLQPLSPSLSASGGPQQQSQGVPSYTAERRESTQHPALPIVDEAGESSSLGGRSRSRSSRFSNRTLDSDERPPTPAKDKIPVVAGNAPPGQFGRLGSSSGGSNSLKPESADSGYGVSGTRSRSGSMNLGKQIKLRLSRESLEKDLPPLPPLDSGVA